jgi:hypothetical protein
MCSHLCDKPTWRSEGCEQRHVMLVCSAAVDNSCDGFDANNRLGCKTDYNQRVMAELISAKAQTIVSDTLTIRVMCQL